MVEYKYIVYDAQAFYPSVAFFETYEEAKKDYDEDKAIGCDVTLCKIIE